MLHLRRGRRPAARARLPRRAAASAAAVLLCAVSAPAAYAASASPSASQPSAAPQRPAGLYGTGDPTYDGVFRQSTALLALDAVKADVPAAAVEWLTGQACADGGFAAYRADTGTPCAVKDEDTNSTGMAVQALARLGGHQAVVTRAVAWLRSAQNTDGGWGYQSGAASDTDSTAIVTGALKAAGTDPASVVRDGHHAADALAALQLGCSAKAAQRGAFAFQPDPKSHALTANDKATTDGVLALSGSGYVVTAPAADRSPAPLDCPGGHGGASAASAYLAAELASHGGHLVIAEPGSSATAPDYGTTADAVLALAADDHAAAASQPYQWLVKNAGGWAKGNPAGLGTLVLASAAVGQNPHDFGGTDLVAALLATGPHAAPSSSAGPAATTAAHSSSSGGTGVWWIVGVCLVAGVGGGLLLSTRGRKRS